MSRGLHLLGGPHPLGSDPGGNLSQEDPQAVWQTPPAGAVIWDGRGRVPNSLGSYSAFYGPQDGRGFGEFGPIWGYNEEFWQNGERKWTLRFGRADVTNNTNKDDLGASDAAAASAAYQQDPRKGGNLNGKHTVVPFGPLIGNPNGPLAGLRYATDTGQWFWPEGSAPAQFSGQDSNTVWYVAGVGAVLAVLVALLVRSR